MKCPNDSATLVMSERSGVEIDYCPECRGVWLDRGELDKILERAAGEFARANEDFNRTAAAPQQPQFPTQQQPQYRAPEPQYGQRGSDRGYNNGYNQRPKKKESWLSDLFD